MAGVIVNLGSEEALERYRTCGAYSTTLARRPVGRAGWRRPAEATLADYFSIAEGDLVFFFTRRSLYGIGRVVKLPGAARAALANYPHSWDLEHEFEEAMLWSKEPESPLQDHPFVVFFKPCPGFFNLGVDMDEVLASDPHGYVTSLPFFSGVSFIRVDDFEAAHLASLIMRANSGRTPLTTDHLKYHSIAEERWQSDQPAYEIDVDALIRQYSQDV